MKPKKIEYPDDALTIVTAIIKDIQKVVEKHLKKVDPKWRWLICSRAINSVFQSHYRHVMIFADEKEKEHSRGRGE